MKSSKLDGSRLSAEPKLEILNIGSVSMTRGGMDPKREEKTLRSLKGSHQLVQKDREKLRASLKARRVAMLTLWHGGWTEREIAEEIGITHPKIHLQIVKAREEEKEAKE